ncbi:MAG: AMP-binding protein [Planctomycetota bacterium]|nr:AMP-binding protein [Planctomycetota bacterium]
MTAAQPQQGLSVRRFFAGKGVLVTGSTGFLAKALVEKILRDLPEVKKVYLLIRPRAKADGSLVDPRERLREEILRNSAFSRLREQMGERFEAWCQERIACVPGDLTHPRLGLDEAAFENLAREVQIVIGSAATVVFDERLDLALDINTLSPLRLLELAKAAKGAYLHISTAYVSGMRKGLVPERILNPLEAIDAQLAPGLPRPDSFDLEREIEKLRTLAKIVTSDCETQARKNGWAPESEEARTALHRALVSAGMRRARSLGWNDTYTYTKFLGEQLVLAHHEEVPTAIVRPSIIESSLREPEPGWLDGLRMADPLIIGFGKGRLADFPAQRNVVLDIIPADLVVNAILASAAYVGETPGAFELLHVASSSENPLVFDNLYQTVRDYFQKHPMLDRDGRPVRVPHWKFPTVERFKRRLTYRYLTPVKALGAIVDGPVPLPGTRKLRSRLRSINHAAEQLLYYVDIYSPYTNLDCRFETRRGHEIFERLIDGERELFDFDARKIPWRRYLQDVHIPGLKRNILRMDLPPRAGAGEGTLLQEEAEKGKARASIRGVPQTIVELAARGADRFGGKSFLDIRRAGGQTRYTFGEFWEKSAQWARKLRANLGLAHGDRVALYAENGPEWPLAYLAVARAGGIVVPLDRQLPPVEAARLAAHVGARALIVSPGIVATAGEALAAGQGLPPRLNLQAQLEPHEGDAWPYPHASLGDRPLAEPSPETPASILFTSGTTLAPKGVILSHVNFTSNALSVAEVLEPLPSDQFLSVLPLHHALEFTGGFLSPLFGGSTIHFVESIKDIEETMKRTGTSVIIGVPRIYQLFADKIRARIEAAGVTKKVAATLADGLAGAAELMGSDQTRRKVFGQVHQAFGGKLRVLVSGGAPLAPELFHFFKRFGLTIVEGYGLTETAPILTVNPLAAPKAGSVGLPLPGVEVKVKNPDHQGVGEVLARGPMVMQGYWNDPESTEKVYEDGWFRTGDLGRVDAEGYLFLTGRVKDVVVTAAGKKVYPDEIEMHFRGLPRAKEFCAVGMPARKGQGEELTLVVVPEKDNEKAREEIRQAIDRINHALPTHQQVARIEFQAQDLPKTSTLKVQRNRVREEFAGKSGLSGLLPSVPATGTPARVDEKVHKEVVRAIAEIAGVAANEVQPEQKLQLDLGLDSIGRVDLIGKLELRLNVSISDEVSAKLWTVQDVSEAAAAALSSGAKGEAKGKTISERVLKKDGQDTTARMAPRIDKTLLQGAMRTTEKLFFNAYLSIDAYGLENLPVDGPFVLAANHSSHLDTAAIRSVMGRRSTMLHVMGAKDYFFDTRLKSWFFSTVFNVLPFEREENTLEGLATCRTALDSGKALLIFPEGTRSLTGKLQPFKPGIGILALELDYPVVPVYLSGTFESLPKGRSIPRPTSVLVRFGPPLDFSPLKARRDAEPAKPEKKERKKAKGGGSMELYRAAAEQIRAAVERLSKSGL